MTLPKKLLFELQEFDHFDTMSMEAYIEQQQHFDNNDVLHVQNQQIPQLLLPTPSPLSLPPLYPRSIVPLSQISQQQEERQLQQSSDSRSRHVQKTQIPLCPTPAAIMAKSLATPRVSTTLRPTISTNSSGSVELVTEPYLTSTLSLPLNRHLMNMSENNHQLYNGNNGANITSFALNTIISTNDIKLATTGAIPLEHVMPGIYLSKDFLYWQTEHLHSLQFTHIIIIDKHVQKLYYPIMPNHHHHRQQQQQQLHHQLDQKTYIKNHLTNDTVNVLDDKDILHDYDLHNRDVKTMTTMLNVSSLNFDTDFQVIDLHFGEKNYLTNVLPNCYRAVKFMDKAIERNGKILVIDCNGGEQKCLTIVVAYLMFKHNIKFRVAFDRVKNFYTKADLDRFYITQLYEYEPIVQVQRAQLRGHSCSRALHAATLKRKNLSDETQDILLNNNYKKYNYNDDFENFFHIKDNAINTISKHNKNINSSTVCHGDYDRDGISHIKTHLLGDYLNPLNDFNTTIQIRKKHDQLYNEHTGQEDVDEEECKNFEMFELDKTVTAVAQLTKMARTNNSFSDCNGNNNIEDCKMTINAINRCWNVEADYRME